MMKKIKRPSADHIRQVTVKDTIILHYTAGGTLAGAESELAKPDTINVHYILDRDGLVYQYIDERYWAYHTGANNWNKRSIGIEIVNWGQLLDVNGMYLPWTRRASQAVAPEMTEKCVMFRGSEYYERLTNDQMLTLPELIADIMSRHDIIHIKTHAEVNTGKADFPPDHGIYAVIDSFLGDRADFYDYKTTAIPEGKERNYTLTEIQNRINHLIAFNGWKNEELSRLITYRNRLK